MKCPKCKETGLQARLPYWTTRNGENVLVTNYWCYNQHTWRTISQRTNGMLKVIASEEVEADDYSY